LSEGLEGRWIGVALGVSTALIYSVYILVGSRVLAEEDSLAAATVVMLSAAATFGVVVAITGPRFPATPDAWGAVLAIALVSTVIAMVSFFAGIQRLGAADAATLSTLEPVVTCLLAAIFLGEPVTPLQAVGGAIVLAAVVTLARGEGRTIQVGKGATRSR
jgi:drug/metabolite transporter (DMT)-like permease